MMQEVKKAKNEIAITNAGLAGGNLVKRSSDSDYIQHNKFMVLLKDNIPVSVWTGSTNITEKGIFGQCNTGHIIRDSGLAAKYLSYWNCLEPDPDNANTRRGCLDIQADIEELADGSLAFFSPRSRKKLLTVYSNASAIQSSWFAACFLFHLIRILRMR
jgi:hypothetical protein